MPISNSIASPRSSPSGISAAWRAPRVVAMEIAWRWAFGAAALALIAVAGLRLLGATPVTAADLAAIRGRDPMLAGLAALHVWQHLRLPLLGALLLTVPAI